MLTTIRVAGVVFGLGAGALAASAVGLGLWLMLAALGASEPLAGLLPAMLVGFAVAGWVAGRMAHTAAGFNGSVSGLALAALVVLIAVLGGSPAPPLQTVLLAVIGILTGRIGGVLAARRQS